MKAVNTTAIVLIVLGVIFFISGYVVSNTANPVTWGSFGTGITLSWYIGVPLFILGIFVWLIRWFISKK